MEILKISPISINGIAKIVANNIKKGKLVIIPADTAYALSTNALDEKAIKKVYDVKNRNPKEPIHIFINSVQSAENYSFISENQKKVMNRFLPGPYTFILKKKDIIPSLLTAGMDTIGIRIPDNEFITLLCNYCETPFTATSANKSGLPTIYSIHDIIQQYGEEAITKHFSNIVENDDYILGETSTIIDIIDINEPKILRKGKDVSKKEIHSRINKIINL
jgi:L-threonylcarbamoyladenylate synthase